VPPSKVVNTNRNTINKKLSEVDMVNSEMMVMRLAKPSLAPGAKAKGEGDHALKQADDHALCTKQCDKNDLAGAVWSIIHSVTIPPVLLPLVCPVDLISTNNL
jgi:hypothetical protein